MTCNLWIRKALSSCLMVAVFATYSMVALANNGKVAGDLTVLGKEINSAGNSVLVNGEAAQSGRSVFSASTITTPEGTSAIISVSNIGKIEIAPNSSFTFKADANKLGGDLLAGKVTVLSATAPVSITTAVGTLDLNSGETASAAGRQDDDDDDDGGAAWWLFALGMGGALAGIVYAVTRDSNEANIGGGGTVISPVR